MKYILTIIKDNHELISIYIENIGISIEWYIFYVNTTLLNNYTTFWKMDTSKRYNRGYYNSNLQTIKSSNIIHWGILLQNITLCFSVLDYGELVLLYMVLFCILICLKVLKYRS